MLLFQSCSARRADRPNPSYLRVLPTIAFEMLRDSPDLPVLDLRRTECFTGPDGHLRNAKNIPLDDLPARLDELETLKQKTLLVYCDSPPCSETGMRLLRSHGFEDAILIEGGIEAWIESGYRTVHTSADDDETE